MSHGIIECSLCGGIHYANESCPEKYRSDKFEVGADMAAGSDETKVTMWHTGARLHQLVACECGEHFICLCGRCVKCGRRRTEPYERNFQCRCGNFVFRDGFREYKSWLKGNVWLYIAGHSLKLLFRVSCKTRANEIVGSVRFRWSRQ